jgi:hypothetical protein
MNKYLLILIIFLVFVVGCGDSARKTVRFKNAKAEAVYDDCLKLLRGKGFEISYANKDDLVINALEVGFGYAGVAKGSGELVGKNSDGSLQAGERAEITNKNITGRVSITLFQIDKDVKAIFYAKRIQRSNSDLVAYHEEEYKDVYDFLKGKYTIIEE